MVTQPVAQSWTLLAQASPLLDPPTRAVLAMALLAFVILGMGLIVGVLLGGRWFRRWGGDSLREPLPLRRAKQEEKETPLAMLRGVHRDESGDPSPHETAKTDPAGRPTDDTRLSDSKHSA